MATITPEQERENALRKAEERRKKVEEYNRNWMDRYADEGPPRKRRDGYEGSLGSGSVGRKYKGSLR